jgi:hypothetical protein
MQNINPKFSYEKYKLFLNLNNKNDYYKKKCIKDKLYFFYKKFVRIFLFIIFSNLRN